MSQHKNSYRDTLPDPVTINRALGTGTEVMLRQTETQFEHLSAKEIARLNEEYEANGAFIICQPLEAEIEKTAMGIIKSAKPKREERALVVLVGPGEYQNGILIAPTQEPGQIVSITKYGGTPYELEGHELKIVHMKQIYVTKKKPE